MKYENRIVAYIDILGFKEMLDKTTKDDEDIEVMIDAIADAYRVIRKTFDLDDSVNISPSVKESLEEENRNKKKVISVFSDTIVVSFLHNAKSELFWTILAIQWMIVNLINRGILCRGAIAQGKLIHDDKKIFGPALVEAYLTESKAALYPRVIISQDIITQAAKHGEHEEKEEKKYLMKMLSKDTDGMYFIDYFSKFENEMDSPEEDFPIYVERMANLIRKGVRSRRPDVKIKYMWMKEKLNNVIMQYKTTKVLERLYENGYSDVAKKWKRMKNA